MRRNAPSRAHQGQALVEAALIIPVLLLIGLASVDFGRAYFAGVGLMHGAREGARYVASSTGSRAPSQAQAQQRVVDAIGGFVQAESSTTAGALIATGDVTITVRNSSGTSIGYTSRAGGDSVQVEVSGFVPFYTSFIVSGVDGIAPGLNLCTGSGSSRRCGIAVYGQAFMVVL